MISFILNDRLIQTDKPAGMPLLDFIRYEQDLKGTKSGCREGDCGACTVIEGKLVNGKLQYRTIVSCLTPLGNVQGKHIVTVEGLNTEKPSPVQVALVEHNGTQCGFCTPGFVVSLTAYLMAEETGPENAIAAIDGNICRCTGYQSIKRASEDVEKLKSELTGSDSIRQFIEKKIIPDWFGNIEERLKAIPPLKKLSGEKTIIIGGGTDLMVQQPDDIRGLDITFLHDADDLKGISFQNNYCTIGAETPASEIMNSIELQRHFPKLKEYFKLISSTQIRNMGTLAGNFVNASPIGDLSIIFLALNADIYLNENEDRKRKISLKDFFLDYKKLDLHASEIIEKIVFRLPDTNTRFHFEKVGKRTHLDIASVNSAILLKTENDVITEAYLSAGGVSPVPLYLKETSAFLKGKEITAGTVVEANHIAQQEISPISDIRGSEAYKRLLLRQLIFIHFLELFPEMVLFNELIDVQT
ncbi:MAG: 2Fe-2S iron-sulfur cluster binding domain-containing protein [Chlorobi bacterium]|nr:2Fe-2S iron-sulfur cluster binding domain-containing protein [Chlorobiota bacterium]